MEKKFQGKFENLAARWPRNVECCINVCCFKESLPWFEEWRERVDGGGGDSRVYWTYGCHPNSASQYDEIWETQILEAMTHPRCVAWGECGLDFHKNKTPRDTQLTVFQRQLSLAVPLSKPLVIHARAADECIFDVLCAHVPPTHKIHLHCWNDSRETMQKLLSHFPNLYVGFTGCITFDKNTHAEENVRACPLERLLLESDGPFLAPVPYRYARSHPGMIGLVAQRVAEIKRVPIETVVSVTRANTRDVYGV
eukprot:GDKI01006779.1.p1 GENE.GDKI01006779.1~~GDKI01006779.1.p1  ORF type:complete len:290 (+),score=30.52 GDKI01006779.1:113-871(+)